MITVDRLSLRLAGVSRSGAEAIARAVAERLAAASGFDSDCRGGNAQRPALAVTVEARHGESQTELAGRIANEILRSLERSLG